ncbi:hypothetical protein RFF05_03850 [Bengtsoniella intestinalis]|uniref:DUF6809 family protein n=1 Tax=Bengtsoniella intestinalis TaxID=3073143 RepID=UPI00391F521C
MNLIEELYYGAVCPSTKIKIQSPAYHKAMNNLSQNEELLSNLLEGKEKKLFLDIMNDYTTTQGELTVAHFVAGFRLGAGLMAEVSPAEIEPYLREQEGLTTSAPVAPVIALCGRRWGRIGS